MNRAQRYRAEKARGNASIFARLAAFGVGKLLVLMLGLSVAIGSETGVEPLAECSIVVAPYEVEGQQVGTVGVLGPTRLNYPQALSAVAIVSQRLGDRLSEG